MENKELIDKVVAILIESGAKPNSTIVKKIKAIEIDKCQSCGGSGKIDGGILGDKVTCFRCNGNG